MTVATKQNFVHDIIAIFESTLRLPSGKLDADANFEDFGIDSIIAMELINNLSKKFNISMSPSKFTDVNTVRGLADILEVMINDESVDENDSLKADAQTAREEFPTEKRIETNNTHIRQAPISSKSRHSRVAKESYQKLLNYINQKYNIDLSYRSYNSVDEIVDTLLVNHTDDLLFHYDMLDKFDGKEFRIEEKNPSVTNEITTQPQQIYDIAIVGISCNFPDAPSSQIFWDNLTNQKNSIREIPKSRWNWEDFYANSATPGKTVSRWGALLNDIDCFDPHFFNLKSEEALLIDPQERLLMQEVYKAFQDGGIDPVKLKGTDTGVFVAYEYSEYEHYMRKNIDAIPVGQYGPIFTSSSPTYYLANRLSFIFDFYGPSESINVNCAGSAVAMNRAYYSLVNNESSVAVVGGVSLNLFVDDYIILSQYGMLSPNGTCAVFDDSANGFTRGEGVATVILKRLDDAERDNNKIYGIIKSSHQSNRGNARFLSEIKHESITNVISDCYEKASINPETINYIEVDGFATKWGDSFEFEGIKNVFKDSKSKEKKCALGSVKGNIGNLESVNGLAGFIKLALSLYHKKFPATISKKTMNTFIDIDNQSHPLYIASSELSFDALRRHNDTPIRAGLNSFADSGVNVHIVLEEYSSEIPSNTEIAPSSQLFILSAKKRERLEEYIQEYISYISTAKADSSFVNMIYTLQVGREAMDERLAIIASSHTELLEKLNMVKNSGIQKEGGLEKKGIFYGNVKFNKENPMVAILTKDITNMVVEQSLQAKQWQQVAQLWISGLAIAWEKVWGNKPVCLLSLPAYPFAREKYWIDINDKEKPTVAANESICRDVKKDSIAEVISETTMQSEWFFFMTNGDTKDSSAMELAEKIDLFFKQEIALQLKKPIQKIAADQDFLELGMNSIGMITLIAQVNTLLQINVSPAILFTYSDIKKLTEYLVTNYPEKIKNIAVTKDKEQANNASRSAELSFEGAGGAESAQSSHILVPMHTQGKKRPIFAVPGADGNVITLQHLILALGEQQPFYGLEAVGLGGKTPPLNSVEEIALINIQAIKTIQAAGPYRLLGFSNGGTIAYEMARILLDQHEKVESLILLDSISPLQPFGHMIDDMVEGIKSIFISSSGQKVNLDSKKLKQIHENEWVEYIYNSIKDCGFNFPKEQFAASINVAIANDKCCRAYKPSKLSGEINVMLFRAKEGYIDEYKNASDDYGWNELLIKPIQIYHIEANHFSLIDKDNSFKIAKLLSAVLMDISSEKTSGTKKPLKKRR